MKVLKLSLLLFISLVVGACSNESDSEKNLDEENKITKKEVPQEKEAENKLPRMQELLQGDWKVKEGMGFLSFKGDTVDMNPMGIYTFSIDEETNIISYTPIDENGVAHKNTITKLNKQELILDPAGDSGQHEEYVRD